MHLVQILIGTKSVVIRTESVRTPFVIYDGHVSGELDQRGSMFFRI